jgi:hypothetical protein
LSRALFLILSLVAALAGGTMSARMMLDAWPRLGAAQNGPWWLDTATGGPDMTPYDAAIQQTRVRLPAGGSEGSVHFAATDSSGAALTSDCDYELVGAPLVARLFTLRAETLEGVMITAPDPLPSALHSDALVHGASGFTVAVARDAKPGNWLALRGEGAFKLVLSIYDISVSDGDFGGRLVLPSINRKACR